MGHPWPLLFIFVLFKCTFYRIKTVDFIWTRTPNVGVDGRTLSPLDHHHHGPIYLIVRLCCATESVGNE